MSKFEVTGGTHIGIVSCYGVKHFEVDTEAQLAEAIRKDRNIPEDTKLVFGYMIGKHKVWTFLNPDGKTTLFEFYYTEENNEINPRHMAKRNKASERQYFR